MNFSGYVPVRRGLIEHTMDGRMTNNEALVFVWLLLLADRKTGSYTINQPTLRSFLPGLSKGAAQDALEGLERKGYIFRDVQPRAKVAYRYWINGFAPTDGPHKSSTLDLSEVFATKDPSRLRYVKDPPETQPVTQPETRPVTQPQSPNSNKKEKEKGEERPEKETSMGSKRGESCGDGNSESASDSQSETHGDSGGERKGDTNGDTDGDAPGLHDPLLRGLRYRDGSYYTESGVKVHPNILQSLLEKGDAV